jgi:Tfp pilus assembly protein PilO
MTKLRQLWMLTAAGSVAILLVGYFLVVSPKSSKAAALRADAETQQQVNDKLTSQIAQLNRQKKDLPRQQAELQKFATKIPDNPGLPAVIRSLSDAADTAGVELVGLSQGVPALVSTPGASKPAPVAADDLNDKTKSKPRTAAAPAAPKTLPIAQMPITITVTGNYSQVSQFLSEIENLPRALLVSGFSITPGDNGPTAKQVSEAASASSDVLTVALTGQLFMTTKPAAAPVAVKPAATTAAK